MGQRFTLTIDLGNDAMRTYRDVASALVALAGRLKKDAKVIGPDVLADDDGDSIRDVNGNTVGRWAVEDTE